MNDLRHAIADLRTRRNWLKGWSTTDARNPTLQGMASAAGLSPMALKRLMGEMATAVGEHADRVAQKAEEFERQEAEIAAHRRRLDVERDAIAGADTPERRAEEALDDELKAVEDELRDVNRRMEAIWEALCGVLEAAGFIVMAKSLERTSEPRKPEALRRAQDVMSLGELTV